MVSNFAVRHEPETAFDPARPLATRVSSPLPVTGAALVLLLSLISNVNVLPSGETVVVEVPTVLPFFLSVSSISWSLITFIATVSRYGSPKTVWSCPSALILMGGVHVLHSYMPFCSRYTSGFVGNSTLFISTFQVPLNALCAVAKPGMTNDTRSPVHSSFLMAYSPSDQRWISIWPR